MAETVLVDALVVVLVLGVVQLAYALWVRTVLIDAAAEGARHAALLDGDLASGEERARLVAASAVTDADVHAATATIEQEAGYDVVVVELTAPVPVLGPLGPTGTMVVSGRAVSRPGPGGVRAVLRVIRDGPGGAREGGADGERGSAVVEFLGGTVVLVVPLVYLVLTLTQLQGAAFAAEGAARDTGRIVATASDPAAAAELAAVGVELAFADHGIEVDGADALTVTCTPSCSAPGATALVTVSTRVPLPLWPGGGVTVPVSAEALTVIDAYRERS